MDGTICLSYDCAMALSLVISGAIKFLEKELPKEVLFDTSKKQVTVFLKKFVELQEVLLYLTLSDISFAEDSMAITVSLR